MKLKNPSFRDIGAVPSVQALGKWRYALLLISLLVFSSGLWGQALHDAYEAEVHFRKSGMLVLGSWAAVNMASGVYLRAHTGGHRRYFHEMNAIWNTVNLGIAAAGYIGAMRMGAPDGWGALISEQTTLDKTLLFNAGLDLGYIAGGLYLTERSRRGEENSDRLLGYGRSVMLQGAFLFSFDVVMVLVHQTVQLPEGLSLGVAPGVVPQLAMCYRF